MKLSVVVPAHNEEGCIRSTVEALVAKMSKECIPCEVLIINDNSTDNTEDILKQLASEYSNVCYLNNAPLKGFGFAVRKGLDGFGGDAVAVYMADGSDDPEDLVRFYRKMQEGYDCVFGTRWSKGGKTHDYPLLKKILNRFGNHFIQLALQIRYDDITNAFKLYRREVIDGCRPFLSHHFNLTVELPLKAIVRGYNYVVVPNSWINRAVGISKLRIKEMGSRYFFIVLYCLIEKWLSCGDYRKSQSNLSAVENP